MIKASNGIITAKKVLPAELQWLDALPDGGCKNVIASATKIRNNFISFTLQHVKSFLIYI